MVTRTIHGSYSSCKDGNYNNILQTFIQVADNLKNTPLHCACSHGSIELVDVILEIGADILAENDAGYTPLHIACSQGHEEVKVYFLNNQHTIYYIYLLLFTQDSPFSSV